MRTSGFRCPTKRNPRSGAWCSGGSSVTVWGIALALCFAVQVSDLAAREKDGIQYGAGLIVNVPFSEAEVSQVVQDVVQNGIIRGSKE